PSAATKAWRIAFPSAVRMGIFCTLGSVLEAREADANAAGKIVKTAMEQAAQPDVMLKAPLVAEVGIGPNWAAAH
ncbi:MAG: hypothetical protein EBZ69_06425, partial [Alphaproteobacteria bacterium]|nr:hypothetical protein [Alphaproteobacteria bacterium]